MDSYICKWTISIEYFIAKKYKEMKGIVLAGNPFLLSNNNTILIASIVVGVLIVVYGLILFVAIVSVESY